MDTVNRMLLRLLIELILDLKEQLGSYSTIQGILQFLGLHKMKWKASLLQGMSSTCDLKCVTFYISMLSCISLHKYSLFARAGKRLSWCS